MQSQILRPLFVNYLSRICTLFCIQPADCCIRSVENHIVPVNLNTMFDFSLSCSSYTATCDGRAGVQLSQTAAVFSLRKVEKPPFSLAPPLFCIKVMGLHLALSKTHKCTNESRTSWSHKPTPWSQTAGLMIWAFQSLHS